MIIHGHSIRLVPRRPRDGPKKNFPFYATYHRLNQLIQVKICLFASRATIARIRYLWRADRLPIGLCFWIIAALSIGCWAVIWTFAQAVSGLFP